MIGLVLACVSTICDGTITNCITLHALDHGFVNASATCASIHCSSPSPFPEAQFCAPQDFTCLNRNVTVGGGTTLNAISSGNPDGLLCGFYRTASRKNVTLPDGSLPGIRNRNGTGAQMNVPGLVRFHHVATGLGLSAYQFGNDDISERIILPNGVPLLPNQGQLACGMCLQVTPLPTKAMAQIQPNCNLTAPMPPYADWNESTASYESLIFMVDDQCNDAVCCSGTQYCPDKEAYSSWMDLTIFAAAVDYKNTHEYHLRAVPCPVESANGNVLNVSLQFSVSNRFQTFVLFYDMRVPIYKVAYTCNSQSYTLCEICDSQEAYIASEEEFLAETSVEGTTHYHFNFSVARFADDFADLSHVRYQNMTLIRSNPVYHTTNYTSTRGYMLQCNDKNIGDDATLQSVNAVSIFGQHLFDDHAPFLYPPPGMPPLGEGDPDQVSIWAHVSESQFPLPAEAIPATSTARLNRFTTQPPAGEICDSLVPLPSPPPAPPASPPLPPASPPPPSPWPALPCDSPLNKADCQETRPPKGGGQYGNETCVWGCYDHTEEATCKYPGGNVIDCMYNPTGCTPC